MVAHPVWQLLQTVFYSIFEVFLVCLAGWILARKGILDKKTQKQLNILNVSLFTPCLLFSKVAFFLSPAKLKELWIIPLFFALVSLVSMGVAWFLGWIFRLKRTQRNFAMAAAMFMNSNSLPIALLQSLVVTVPGLQWGDDDNADAMVGRALTYLVMCSTLGMVVRWSYGVRLLSSADPDAVPDPPLGQEATSTRGRSDILLPDETYPREPHSHHLSTQSSHPKVLDEEEASLNEPLIPSIVMHTPSPNVRGDPSLHIAPEVINVHPSSQSQSHLRLHSGRTDADNTVFRSFPNTPYISRSGSPEETEIESELSDSDELPRHRSRLYNNLGNDNGRIRLPSSRSPSPTRTPSTLGSLRKRLVVASEKAWHKVNGFMTAPLWAAILSLVVALIQPLQHSLDVHFWPVKTAISQAGNCSIPLTLIVLGAYFYRPPAEGEDTKKNDSTKGRKGRNGSTWRRVASQSSLVNSVREMLSLKKAHSDDDSDDEEGGRDQEERRGRRERRDQEEKQMAGETRTVWVAIVSRMIIVPTLFLPLMVLGAWLDVPTVFEDPVFILALVLLASSPPALTLAQITQAASGDAFERLLSRTIFWSYCIVTPPVTIVYSVLAMVIAKL